MGVGSGKLVLLACLAAALAGCSGSEVGSSTGALELSQPALDFGLVAIDASVPKTLVLRNTGRAALQVAAPSASAPFEIAAFPAEGLLLRSGERREIVVVFHPRRAGRFRSALRLDNDAAEGPVEIALSGEGVRAVLDGDRGGLDFGQVPLGGSRELSLELINDSGLPIQAPLRLVGADASAFSVGAPITRPLVVDPHRTVRIPVVFVPDRLGGFEAQLLLTACQGCRETPVALSGEGIAGCLALEPGALDFGPVAPGGQASLPVRVRNAGARPVEVSEVFLAAGGSSDFRVEGFAPGERRPLAPGAELAVTVTFAPTGGGERRGTLRVGTGGSGPDACWAALGLQGEGASGCLQAIPAMLDFGTVATGSRVRRYVTVANTGCGEDAWLEAASFSGDPSFGFAEDAPALPRRLGQGESLSFAVGFAPGAPGSFRGALELRASDARREPLERPPVPVPLRGLARTLAPCVLAVTPPRLSFGAVEVGGRASLLFQLRNEGIDDCFVSDLGLVAPSAPAYSITGGHWGFLLPPGHGYDVWVHFAPEAPGSLAATLGLSVSDPADPRRTFPISGRGGEGCLAIEPRELDFQSVAVGCPAPVRSSRISNRCPADLLLRRLVPGPDAAGEFGLLDPPPFPRSLRAGESFELTVRYAPADRGLDVLPLYLDDGDLEHLVVARGTGLVAPRRTDRFEQVLQKQVDVLFVLDNSGSMADKQAAVGANLAAFLSQALAQGADYRLAVTTTGLEPSTGGWTSCPGGAEGGEGGRLFPVDGSSPRVITAQTPGASAVWARNTQVGVCHWLEQGLEAAYRALSSPLIDQADDPRTAQPSDGNQGFLRPDARLALVFVSDEEDQSSESVDFYLAFFRGLKPNPDEAVSISAIVTPANLASCPAGTTAGNRYAELATRAGGQVESICTPDWAASLGRLGEGAFGAQSVFPLSEGPSDPQAIEVRVNGQPVAAAGRWRYDPATRSVRFEKAAVPAAGSRIEISYPVGCPVP